MIKRDEDLWKCPPCKKGDFIEVSESLYYTAKTLYKVAYYNPLDPRKLLVEVDPELNYLDKGWIGGWVAKNHLSSNEIKRYQLNPEKRYWWINWWNFKRTKLLKNE